MKRLVMYMLFAAFAAAETPDAVFQVSVENGKWIGRNAGQQSITAYVLHAGPLPPRLLNGQNVSLQDLRESPIAPGATVDLVVRPVASVHVLALILADGTVLCSARTAEGEDLIDLIFEIRNLNLQELRHWQQELLSYSDHRQAVEAFGKVQAPAFVMGNNERLQHDTVQTQVAGWAASALQHRQAGEDGYPYLAQPLAKALATAEAAVRRAQ